MAGSHGGECVSVLCCVQLFESPWTVALQAPLPMEFPGKNTGVGSHFLLQGTFPTQWSNPRLSRLLNWQAGSLPALSGKPWITG